MISMMKIIIIIENKKTITTTAVKSTDKLPYMPTTS